MDVRVRALLPNVEVHEAGRIASLLANDQTWPSDDERLDQLRRYLFEPNYGTASRKAADILLGLLTEPTPVREPMESAITG